MEADIIIYGKDFIIIIEVDPCQHSQYKKVSEVDRQEKVMQIFEMPVHLVRFRPRTRHREAEVVRVVQASISSRAEHAREFGLFVTYIGYTWERVEALHVEARIVLWGERLNGAEFPFEVLHPVMPRAPAR